MDGGTLDEREYLIVRGTVQQIVYYNDENGYAVLRLAAENGAEVTATGTFPNIGLGEEVILTGAGDAPDLRRAVCDRGV